MNIGFELEVSGNGLRYFAAAIGHEYGWSTSSIPVDINGITFTAGHDGSIRPDGIEIKSPILDSGNIDCVNALIPFLKSKGYKHHVSCGLHVHVEAPDSVRCPYKVAAVWNNKRNDILKEFPIWNYRSQYCANGVVTTTKYTAIRVHPTYPTLEFRLFNGLMSANHIRKAVRTSVAFVSELILANI